MRCILYLIQKKTTTLHKKKSYKIIKHLKNESIFNFETSNHVETI